MPAVSSFVAPYADDNSSSWIVPPTGDPTGDTLNRGCPLAFDDEAGKGADAVIRDWSKRNDVSGRLKSAA
jgi:hypothetical protein